MSEKILIELGSIQKTLLLPLWGRAVEAQKSKPLLIDKISIDIIGKIEYDFSTITQNLSPISQLAWIARCLHIDRTVKKILEAHPQASIVNIGCGLDTTFNRVDSGLLLWYDLDLPDVISLRKKLIPEHERCTGIACSLLDDSWFSQVKNRDTILFIAAGVLYYFEEAEIKGFLKGLADVFPGSEILFDAASPLGVKLANKKVIEAGGMDESSVLKWGFETAKQIQIWDKRFKLIEEYPMFNKMKRGLSFRDKYGTLLSDFLNIMFMVHLKFL